MRKVTKFKCFECDLPLTEDNFCYGCNTAVCNNCDKSVGLFGSHSAEDHLNEEDEDDM